MPKDIQGSSAFNTGSGPYRPPEFFDSGAYLKGDIDKWHGQSRMVAQGGYKRLKKMEEGILLVRFELPVDVWCSKCDGIIVLGTRYNDAEKTKAGKYFSTPIYNFRFKHGTCGNTICIQNDPKNATYNITEGGTRRITDFDKEAVNKKKNDPIANVAKREEARATAQSDRDNIISLRKKTQSVADTSKLLLNRHKKIHGLYLTNRNDNPLLGKPTEEDFSAARKISFGNTKPTVAAEVALMKQRQSKQLSETAKQSKKIKYYNVVFQPTDNHFQLPTEPYKVPRKATYEELSLFVDAITGSSIRRRYNFRLPPSEGVLTFESGSLSKAIKTSTPKIEKSNSPIVIECEPKEEAE
eukprot:TRINITY_DN20917_c0_g1_i1.p1 TRINITY_DN20917_c0_g1~~TRINITY_DN20917_c0_g1_i1.p1  ORF type:complete len:354 (+),score=73.14 TRINITY_DN20917_c0_g1_i1:93-1154(+)